MQLSSPFPVRTYHLWKGNNVFCFGGRLIFGPQLQYLCLSIFFIVGPVSVFCGLVALKLSNYFPHHLGWSIMVGVVALTLLVLILLVLISGRDPGIVPRSDYSSEPYDNTNDGLPERRDEIVNGITVEVKYCRTCLVYRPLRSHHCSTCDNCVERWDHHCPFLAQCIGLRNYRFYYIFLWSTTLLYLYIFAFCWVCFVMIQKSEKISFRKAMIKTPASIVLMIASLPPIGLVGSLTLYHTYLIIKNKTTSDDDEEPNPYNRGIVKNIREILCKSVPPSKLNWRSKVQVQIVRRKIQHNQPEEEQSDSSSVEIDTKEHSRNGEITEQEEGQRQEISNAKSESHNKELDIAPFVTDGIQGVTEESNSTSSENSMDSSTISIKVEA